MSSKSILIISSYTVS